MKQVGLLWYVVRYFIFQALFKKRNVGACLLSKDWHKTDGVIKLHLPNFTPQTLMRRHLRRRFAYQHRHSKYHPTTLGSHLLKFP